VQGAGSCNGGPRRRGPGNGVEEFREKIQLLAFTV